MAYNQFGGGFPPIAINLGNGGYGGGYGNGGGGLVGRQWVSQPNYRQMGLGSGGFGGNGIGFNIRSNDIIHDVGNLVGGIGHFFGSLFGGGHRDMPPPAPGYPGNYHIPQGVYNIPPQQQYMPSVNGNMPAPPPQNYSSSDSPPPPAPHKYVPSTPSTPSPQQQAQAPSAGEERARMQAAQAMLETLGFQTQGSKNQANIDAMGNNIDARQLDGVDGAKTSKALIAVQGHHGLAQTGDIDAATFQALQADIQALPAGFVQGVPPQGAPQPPHTPNVANRSPIHAGPK